MVRRSIRVAALAVSLAGGGQLIAVGTGVMPIAHARRAEPASHAPAQPARCPAADDGTEVADGDEQTALTVHVPPTAIVTIDRAGRIVSATTNTGCPPKTGDDAWYRYADGSLAPAPNAAVDRKWFSAGGDTYMSRPVR